MAYGCSLQLIMKRVFENWKWTKKRQSDWYNDYFRLFIDLHVVRDVKLLIGNDINASGETENLMRIFETF